jgi:NAD(P)-dependent dehydrogenase (short-subunit alcohol dehydrogenase family)
LQQRRGGRDHNPVPESAPEALRAFDLAGRVALITGGSSGLGQALARSLSQMGADVAVVARRADRLDVLAAEIGGQAVTADLSDPSQPAAVVSAVAGRLGPPEILVNAAGNIFSHARAEDETPDDIARTLQLNLVAPFRLAQEVFPHMRHVGRGAIVNISSISGHVGIPSIPQASYAASKLGLSGLTAELAVQWARHSIRVNTVAPGFFRSEITESLYDDERGAEWLRRNTPLPMKAAAEDFVGAVLWLVSDAGRYVTGQTIVVDGGWTAR